MEAQLLFDAERDQLLYMGWDGFKQVFYPIVHIDVRDGKVWIQHNATEEEIADDLISLGIDRQEIVLGMHHPSLRPYTDFAVV